MNEEVIIEAFKKQHNLTAIAPTTGNEHIENLLVKIGVNNNPMRVPYQFEEYSVAASCYFNVKEKVKRDGGGIVYGWAIWQSDYLCEAEHHAVWHDTIGKLIDITPREPHFDAITFVIDSDVPFNNITIPSVRVNTTNNTLIDDYIIAQDVLNWTRRYEKRKDILSYTLPDIVIEYVGTDEEPGPIMIISSFVILFYLLGNTEDSDCYCKSLKPYKDCHRLINENNLTYYVTKIIETCGKAPE